MYYYPIWWLGNTDLICGNSLTLENFESINTKFWLPAFADIVKVKLEPVDNEIYHKNLKQTLQELEKKPETINLENITNSIVNKALNNKKSKPKVHQTNLFDYLK